MVRRRLAVGGVAGLVGAAAYDSFLLARPLGSTLDPVNSYVSELGVRTQPASAFFRASDVLAGLLILLLALVLCDGLPSHWRGEAGRAALAIAGAASVVDGWHPMGCLPSIAVACRPHRDVIGLLAQLREVHTVSSVIGFVAAVASMLLLGSLLGDIPQWRHFGEIGQLAALVLIALGMLELPLTLTNHWVGLVERIQVLWMSGWFAALALLALRTALPRQAGSQATGSTPEPRTFDDPPSCCPSDPGPALRAPRPQAALL